MMEEMLDTPELPGKKPKQASLIVLSVITFISVWVRLGFEGTFCMEVPSKSERLAGDSSFRRAVFFFLAVVLSAFLLGAVCFTLSISRDFSPMPWFAYLILLSFYLIPLVFVFLYKAALKQKNHGRAL